VRRSESSAASSAIAQGRDHRHQGRHPHRPGLGDTGLGRRHILASAEASLRRLGTDWIDVYIVHRHDPVTPVEETLEALDELVRRGHVRHVGFSNWSAWQAAKAAGIQERRGLAPFIAAQMYYSLVAAISSMRSCRSSATPRSAP